ncbi:major facilitator superfamily domain-containing protein 6-like [Penaeus monodon]|uniref:major facilitator superfamily domain-containing protein 6-like n=1 Tax=Penaeus monodon TaxID=6687 RepID=UPI0018A72753|nr:major facilitator superfamily domain-containing protein 6-like [Penaeus monodon]
MWGINKRLLPIKAHYFLRYAGTAPLTMLLPLMVRQKGIDAKGIGLLWTVMPIVGLITNSISGTLADYLKAHRTVFITSLTFLTVGLTTMYWLPPVPSYDGAEASLGHPAVNNLTSSALAELNLGVLDDGRSNETQLSLEEILESDSLFLVDPEMVVEEGHALPPDPKTATKEGTVHDTSSLSSTISMLMQFPQFWLVFFALMVEQMGLTTCVMISDAVCFQILGSERHKYGQQRLWGTVGMGLTAIVSGALVDLYSRGLPQQDFLPMIIMALVLMSVDLAVVARMDIPQNKKEKLKMGDVGSALIHPQVLLFLVTVYVVGTSLGLLWVFKLMHIEDVALAWDSGFSNLKLLQGIDMGIETFGGEVPFFFISGMIIQKLGHTPVMAIAIGSLALRCSLYYLVVNPWWFLPIELLNGLSYGLFHTVMASYASHIAPPGAQATLQAIVRACFSSGLSTAGFLGGNLMHSLGGSLTFLAVGIFNFGFCFVFVSLQFLIIKFFSHRKIKGDSGYMSPSSSTPSAEDSSVGIEESSPVKEPLVEDV